MRIGDYIHITANHLLKMHDDTLVGKLRLRRDKDYEIINIDGDSLFIFNEDYITTSININHVSLSLKYMRNETIDTILS